MTRRIWHQGLQFCLDSILHSDKGIYSVHHGGTNLCSNTTPRSSQRRRSRRRRRRRRRRYRSGDRPMRSVSSLSSSSKRSDFRLGDRDHLFYVADDVKVRDVGFVPSPVLGSRSHPQRPRGPGDSRSLIHSGDELESIEGFDFRCDFSVL